MNQLTAGSIKAIFNKEESNPLYRNNSLQVINIKPIPNDKEGLRRYRAILSDGLNFMQGFLNQALTPLIESAEIKKNTIIRLTKFNTSDAGNKRLLVIAEVDIITSTVEGRLGEPTNIDNTGPAINKPSSAQQPQQQTPQQQMPSSSGQPLFMQSGSGSTSSGASNYSGGSVNMQLEASLFPIKGLNPYQNKWTIRARVTQKSDIKTWANARSEGKLFSVNLLDQSGEIKATAFKEQVDRLYPILEEGKVYYISRARVTMAKKQFSTLDNEYELTFDHATEVELCSNEQSIPEMNYTFVKIGDMDKHEKNDVVDVIAVVCEDSGLQEIISKASGRPMKKRELSLVDDTQKQIRLTLWENVAETFDATGNPVVACKAARVNDFNGRSLSLTSGGNIKKNPNIPEAQKLQSWYQQHGQSANYSTFTSMPSESNTFTKAGKMFIQEAKSKGLGESEKPDYFETRATVMFIKNDNFAYPGCPTCKKKLAQETNGWRCEKCQQTFEKPDYRYLLVFSAEDATSQLFLNCFDEVGNTLIGMSANELTALRDEDDQAFRRVFDKAYHKTYNFKIKASQTVFNDTPRTKYQVMEAAPIDFVREGQELVAAIDKLII